MFNNPGPPDLHENSFLHFILWTALAAIIWAPLLIFFSSIMEWVDGFFNPTSILGKWLAAEAGAILAWLLVMAALGTIVLLAVSFQEARERQQAKRKLIEEKRQDWEKHYQGQVLPEKAIIKDRHR